MMKLLRPILLPLLLLATIPVFAQTGNTGTAQQQQTQQQAKNTVGQKVHERDGNLVFAQNCSRCHNAPEGFSPRIAGTVARHMRVRAGLSKEDEQAILRFLNP
jgi:cytochrome c5